MVPREWIQPIRNGLRLMRAHSATFSMLACHGKGWKHYTKAAFLSLRRHHLPSSVRLCNNQTDLVTIICQCNRPKTCSRICMSRMAH